MFQNGTKYILSFLFLSLLFQPKVFSFESVLDANEIRQQIRKITIEGHKPLSYTDARKYLFGYLHLQQTSNGEFFVKDVYCEREFSNNSFPADKGVGPFKVPDDKILNVEHTWPQSLFSKATGKDVQKADLHHLFPSDSEINSFRGNFRFGSVFRDSKFLKCPISRLGYSEVTSDAPTSNKTLVFMPPVQHRGEAARAIFYFAVRYNLPIEDNEENQLKRWNQEDPVNEFESARNNEIQKLQGNRNPFIDHPEWIPLIPNY